MSDSTSPATIALVYIIALLVFVVPAYVIFWKLFKKAGQPGWKYLIPIYSQYVMGVIAGSKNLGLTVAISWALYIVLSFDKDFAPAMLIAALTYMVVGLILLSKFIQKYDAGIGKWFLFLFVPVVGVFMVNSVNYKGGTSGPSAVGPETPGNTTPTTPSPAPADAAPAVTSAETAPPVSQDIAAAAVQAEQQPADTTQPPSQV